MILSLSSLPDGGEQRLISTTDTDQFCYLLGLLPKLPQGKRIWHYHQDKLLERSICLARGTRFAAFCIYTFLDRSDKAHSWLLDHVDSFSTWAESSMARLALWVCFGETLPLPKENENGFTIWSSVSWWPTRLFLDDRATYAALATELGQLVEYHRALAHLPFHLWGTAPSFVRNVISSLTVELKEQVVVLEGGGDPQKWILFDQLVSPIDTNTLQEFWGDESSELEAALVRYLEALGPIASRSKGRSDSALPFLLMLSGLGIDEVASFLLAGSSDFYCLLRAFDLLERSCTPANAVMLQSLVANTDLITNDDNEYASRGCISVLCHHGYWDLAVDGVIRFGLNNLRDLEYIEAKPWPDSALKPVLSALQAGPSPGALLALGLSGRKEFSHLARNSIRDYPANSEVGEAAWLALDLLEDCSDETLELTKIALTDSTREHRGLSNIAHRFSISSQTDHDEKILSNLNLPKDEDFIIRRFLDLLRFSGSNPPLSTGIDSLIWDQAFTRTESIFVNTRIEAIRALSKLSPSDSLIACKDALRSLRRPLERLQIPRLMLVLDRTEALRQFRTLLIEEPDVRLVVAVGEALAHEGEKGQEVLLSWLQDEDEILREGAAMAARAFPWSDRLESQLRTALNDTDWRVRDEGERALIQILKHVEIIRLCTLLKEQVTLARKWAAMEAAVELGHPGVSGVWPLWLDELMEGLPYLARRFAQKKVEELSKKLLSELGKKKRDHTRLVLRRSQARSYAA